MFSRIYDFYLLKIIYFKWDRFMILFSIAEPSQTPLLWVNVFIKAQNYVISLLNRDSQNESVCYWH